MNLNNEESLLSLEKTISSVNGIYIGSETNKNLFYFSNVVTDSRNVVENSLFVPLVGEFQNGHIYVDQAIEKGATVIFIDSKEYESNSNKYKELTEECKNLSVIVVENTLYALQAIAETYVEQFPNLIKVAITGSSGKTTTKELVVAVLKQKYNVVHTEGNFNSETGLPLSVFKIRKEHEVGVFEMGMNRQDEIGEISKVLKPEYAIITNIGSAHIGMLGSRDNIAIEKKKAFTYVSKTGAVFIPAEDEYCNFLQKDVLGKVVLFGENISSDVNHIEYLKDCGLDGSVFCLDGIQINLKIPGIYNYRNALASIALAKELDLTAEEIKAGIENLSRLNSRMESSELNLKGNIKVNLIRDCYNANFESMSSVINFCDSLSNVNKRIYVLGDMLELGSESDEIHSKIGKQIAAGHSDYVIFVGEQMEKAAKVAKENGYKNSLCIPFADDDAMLFASQFIVDCVEENDVILLKGSRGIALERIIPLVADSEAKNE